MRQQALDSARDDRTAKLDAEAEDLIVKIDTLGRPPSFPLRPLGSAGVARLRNTCFV